MNCKEPFVITISREVGSGGRTIGCKLAERLGVHFYDKELIKTLMKRFDLNAMTIEEIKGEKKNWLSDFIRLVSPMPAASAIIESADASGNVFNSEITSGDIYKAESEILHGLVEEGSCVIAGRSGFHVLRDCPNRVDVFITASRAKRLERVMTKQGVTKAEAEDILDKVDKSRENYIKQFTGKSRYDARNYNLTLNVDGLSEDEAVDVILRYIGIA